MTQKARLAYLTSPQRSLYILSFQPEGSDELIEFEISKGHLANILISGTHMALRDQPSTEEPGK